MKGIWACSLSHLSHGQARELTSFRIQVDCLLLSNVHTGMQCRKQFTLSARVCVVEGQRAQASSGTFTSRSMMKTRVTGALTFLFYYDQKERAKRSELTRETWLVLLRMGRLKFCFLAILPKKCTLMLFFPRETV
jgi:hypothetical protein